MKNKIILPGHLYFVTSKLVVKEYLFNRSPYINIVIESLKYLIKNKYFVIYSFCLMPNHLHFIIKVVGNNSIQDIMSKFNSFTSHEIIKTAKMLKENKILKSFNDAATKDLDRSNRVWQDVLLRHVTDSETLYNFLEYIHNNPTNKGWRLANVRADYKYSSACFYDKGEKSIIKIEDVSELMI